VGERGGLGVTDLGLEHTLIDVELVMVAHAHGLSVDAWIPNDESALRRFAALGVDVMATNHPDLAIRIRATTR
jgi:glycerophosphoryl diester phosphodiesterase